MLIPVPARIDSGPQGTTYQGGSPIERIHALGVEHVGSYLLYAYADQTVSIDVSSPGGAVLLSILGADGILAQLARGEGGEVGR